MIFLLLIVAALLMLAGGAFLLVRWVRPEAVHYAEDDEDEDTVWGDIREWSLLQRIFGQKPLKLPKPPARDDASRN
jgi:uncharacterized membrane protein